jgi:predicted AAA+ superfamily ATPase
LETGYQIFLLYPYYQNIGKRLVKSPKIYFNDTGVASFLLGLHDRESLLHSPNFGNLFETLIITDVWKRALHSGEAPALYYLRTRDGLEIDLVIESRQKLHLFEIKSAMTIWPKHASSLLRMKNMLTNSVAAGAIISMASQNFQLSNGIHNYNWKNILAI